MSGLLVTVFSEVCQTAVIAQNETVATKLANVNNIGGNIVSDCRSQGAQGVSMPMPSVMIPVPIVARTPIKSNVYIDAFIAIRRAVNMRNKAIS